MDAVTERWRLPAGAERFGEVDDGSIRVAPLGNLGKTLAEFNVDLAPLLASFGLPADYLVEPDNTISFVMLGELLARAEALTACPHLGLLIGLHAPPSPLGMLSDLLPHCNDVATALTYLQDFFHLHDRGAMPTRWVEGETASLGYSILAPVVTGVDHIHEAALVIGCKIMQGLCGPRWRPQAVQLARRWPADPRPYREIFACPLEFDSEQYALVFPAADLKRAIACSDRVRFRVLSERLSDLRSQADFCFLEQVRRAVQGLVVLRRCSLDQVAAAFAVNRRTMNRMLAASGTTYREQLESVRRTLAQRLIAHTDLPLAAIAATLDYSDPSAFCRAYRAWVGETPRGRNRKQGPKPMDASGPGPGPEVLTPPSRRGPRRRGD